MLSAISAEVACNPELGTAFRQEFLAGLQAQLQTIVRRGVDRGELPETTDVELLAAVGPGLLHHHRVMTGEPMDERLARRIVDQFFPKRRRSTGQ